MELSNRESRSSWSTFVKGLKARGLHGVEFVVSDDHAGLKRRRAVAARGRLAAMLVHFLRNALDYLPRKADGDCRQELPWPYDRRDLKEAQQDLQAWLQRWEQRFPRLTDGVEPQEHRDHDMLDLVNGYRVRRNEAPAREPTRVPGRDLPAGDCASDPIVDLRVADSGTLGNMSMCGGAQLVAGLPRRRARRVPSETSVAPVRCQAVGGGAGSAPWGSRERGRIAVADAPSACA